MIYKAQVTQLSDIIEEEVTLRVGDVELTCFAASCPYAIDKGMSYPVELHLTVFNRYIVTALADTTSSSIVRVGNSFEHVITGRLNGCYLEACGIIFQDEVFQRDYGHLNGQIVAMTASRIDADFLTS